MLFPYASVNFEPATSMVVDPYALGVNVAVYVVPDPAKLLRVPPATVISPCAKLVVALLEVKVNNKVASFVVEPLETLALPSGFVAVISMFTGVLSDENVIVDAILWFPYASVYDPPGT